MTDVLIVVTHLHGIGHLQRAAALARAAAAAGLATVLASGGRPVRGLDPGGAELVQIAPALRVRDETFAELLTEDRHGRARTAGADALAARAEALAALVTRLQPRVLVTEMYPFGRRKLRGEFEAAIAAAQALPQPARLVASVRDILTDKPAEKTAWMAEAAAPFARILVHGDPALVGLGESFAQIAAVEDRLAYTGYVSPPAPAGARRDPAPQGEVLVSAGGGAFGLGLLMSALLAHSLTAARARPWRLLVGDNLPERDFRALKLAAPRGVRVQRAKPDFARRLAACAVSVSQAGYNTCVQVLEAGCPAVLVPFGGGGQTEQIRRARAFAARGLAVAAEGGDADPPALAAAIDRALATGLPARDTPARPKTDGARVSSEILKDLAAIVPDGDGGEGWGVPAPAR